MPSIEVPDTVYKGRETTITCKGKVGMNAEGQFGVLSLQQKNDVGLRSRFSWQISFSIHVNRLIVR